jgi:hypothetical protein
MTFSTWAAIGRRQTQHADRLLELVMTAPSTPGLQWRLDRHDRRMARHVDRGLHLVPLPTTRPN